MVNSDKNMEGKNEDDSFMPFTPSDRAMSQPPTGKTVGRRESWPFSPMTPLYTTQLVFMWSNHV
jgi:hypothetical protein